MQAFLLFQGILCFLLCDMIHYCGLLQRGMIADAHIHETSVIRTPHMGMWKKSTISFFVHILLHKS